MSQRVPSLYDFLGDLEDDGELQRAADHLASLKEHPGWPMFERMVSVQVEKLRTQMEGKALRDVQTYAHGTGSIFGLRSAVGMVDKAIDAAAAERRRLEKTEASRHDD